MANHGYCKNCWWWKFYKQIGISKKEFGKCYMHKSYDEKTLYTQEDEYCPDYVNRIKEEKRFGKLDDWIDKF